jgi:hypothetical protein
VTANGYWQFIQSYKQSNENQLATFNFPPGSYIIQNFCNPIALLATHFNAGILLGLFSDPADGSDIFSEMSVDFQWFMQHYNPEGISLHNYHCENLKF